jgi:hypothetical protein
MSAEVLELFLPIPKTGKYLGFYPVRVAGYNVIEKKKMIVDLKTEMKIVN